MRRLVWFGAWVIVVALTLGRFSFGQNDDQQDPAPAAPVRAGANHQQPPRKLLALTDASTPTLAVSALSTFVYYIGAALPAPQVVSVSTGDAVLPFSATSASPTTFQVSPSTGLTPSDLTVTATPAGLRPGTYNVAISVAATGAQNSPFSLQATVIVNNAAVSVSPSSLSFSSNLGTAEVRHQTLSISSEPSLPFSATASGGAWLSVSPDSGAGPATVTVTVDPGALKEGEYTGSVSIAFNGGTTKVIGVSLSITAPPALGASPTRLSLNYQPPDAQPGAAIQVSGSVPDMPFTASASTASGGNWLSVTPSTGQTPAVLAIGVDASKLSVGPYSGAITIAGVNGAVGVTVPVTLTVRGLRPTISAVVNAGNFANGPIAPGEIITLGGVGLGPVTAAGLSVTAGGQVANSVAGVEVVFSPSGAMAPLIYVSEKQINAVVPYEVEGGSNPSVQVRFGGQLSDAYPVQLVASAPALFTYNGSGTGPVAAVNADGSANSADAPAARGSVVVLYLTGEGQTTPGGVTGKITTVADTPPLTPGPRLPVTVTIDGQPAKILFSGEAPGIVSGVLQLNVEIPDGAHSGDVPLSVSVGDTATQSGVTIRVK